MKSVWGAFRFLTILPAGKDETGHERFTGVSTILFPLVGVVLGLILAGAHYLLSPSLPASVTAAVAVILLAVLSGCLHLDGFADTADGVFGGRNPVQRLDIMKDSRIGTFGAFALASDCLLKTLMLATLPGDIRIRVLMLLPVSGRWSMVPPLNIWPYARSDGKARSFFLGRNLLSLGISTAIALAFFLALLHIQGALAFAFCAVASLGTGLFLSRKLGGLTGDSLGAINEISEIVFLFSIHFLR